MRIAELTARHRFDLSEGTISPPQPGEVQVRVASVGVCGSDLHNFSEGSVGDTPSKFPMVLGHEPAGTVISTGTGVSGWADGDKALLEPAIYCYHCEYCLSGHYNVCANLRFLSQPGDPGFFREYVNLPVRSLLPLPEGMSFDEGTLFEPLAVVLHSLKFADVRLGDTVVVFGAGPIGLLTIAVLKLSGAARVWAVEPVAHRREMAQAVGADEVLDYENAVPEITRATGGRGADATIDCAAKGGSVNASLHVTRNAGRVVYTAIPSEVRVDLEFHVARRKEIAIFNVRRSNHESELAVALMREHMPRLAPILTHRVPLERIQEGFAMLERYEDGVGKLIIRV